MTAKEYYNNQDRFEYFTKLTNTGISDDFDEIMAFAEAYHEHKLKLLGIADVSDSLSIDDLHFKLRSIFFDKMEEHWVDDDMIHMDHVSDAFDETILLFLENCH